MYAALTTITVSPGMWAQMSKSTDQLFASVRIMKGFKRATFFGDNEAGVYNSLILWDSKEDVEAAWAAMSPGVQQGLASFLKAPIARQMFEVYEPKT